MKIVGRTNFWNEIKVIRIKIIRKKNNENISFIFLHSFARFKLFYILYLVQNILTLQKFIRQDVQSVMYCNEVFFFKGEKVIIRLLLYHTTIVKIFFPTRIYKLKNISYLVFYVDQIRLKYIEANNRIFYLKNKR